MADLFCNFAILQFGGLVKKEGLPVVRHERKSRHISHHVSKLSRYNVAGAVSLAFSPYRTASHTLHASQNRTMNLALLDPFRRQVPDRIDSTLTLGSDLHPPLPTNRKPLTIPRSLATAPSDRASQGEDDVNMEDVSSSSATPSSSSPSKRAEWSIPAAEDWISCHSVAFNRRGTYLAAGHLSGAVPIHDTLSRTVSAVHRPPAFGEGTESPPLTESDVRRYVNRVGAEEQFEYRNGVTSLSWSKRSRLLLVAAIGDRNIRLVDNEHPLGVDIAGGGSGSACVGDGGADAVAGGTPGSVAASSPISVANGNGEDGGEDSSVVAQLSSSGTSTPAAKKRKKSDGGTDNKDEAVATPPIKKKNTIEKFASVKYRILPPADIVSSSDSMSQEELAAYCCRYGSDDALGGGDRRFAACRVAADEQIDSQRKTYTRYQTQILPLPNAVGASVELHPRDCHAGFAVQADGSLILFRFPLGGYVEGNGEYENGKRGRVLYIVHPGDKYFITDAAFGHDGSELYAVTKCGSLLGFRIGADVLKMLRSPVALDTGIADAPQPTPPLDQPAFCIKIHGGAAAWQLVVSRNGRLILINSADCALRLFGAEECWELAKSTTEGQRSDDVKPRYVFQDLISKVAFTSCAFSGDAEYVVGGCNSNPNMGDRYDLYIWNTGTGALIDQLNGPQVELHDVSFHPSRPFIAVATSDGIVDTWGPRMDWTNFAPSFQALPMNIEYVEKEDEFDVVIDGDDAEEERKKKEIKAKLMEEGKVVDVTTVDPVPVFDSDSEEEEDVFRFDTRIVCTLKPRAPSVSGGNKDGSSGK